MHFPSSFPRHTNTAFYDVIHANKQQGGGDKQVFCYVVICKLIMSACRRLNRPSRNMSCSFNQYVILSMCRHYLYIKFYRTFRFSKNLPLASTSERQMLFKQPVSKHSTFIDYPTFWFTNLSVRLFAAQPPGMELRNQS